MARCAAVFGTAIVFVGAYLIEKGQGFARGRAVAQLLAMLPMAVPGLVLGLGYVFFFNANWNPLGVLYGTHRCCSPSTRSRISTRPPTSPR